VLLDLEGGLAARGAGEALKSAAVWTAVWEAVQLATTDDEIDTTI